MSAARAVPYQSLLRSALTDGEVPDALNPVGEANRMLCRACARMIPRSNAPIDVRPPFTRILIATDGSPVGNDAVELGVSLARLAVVPVLFLHAAMPWRGGAWLARFLSAADITVDPGCMALAESSLERARVCAMDAGVRFETRLAYDPHPDRAILDAAREADCDLIVMGSHSGRLARRVGAHAQVPLLTCRNTMSRRPLAPTT